MYENIRLPLNLNYMPKIYFKTVTIQSTGFNFKNEGSRPIASVIWAVLVLIDYYFNFAHLLFFQCVRNREQSIVRKQLERLEQDKIRYNLPLATSSHAVKVTLFVFCSYKFKTLLVFCPK